MSHFMIDERDMEFVLFDWLNTGQLASSAKYAEAGFDESVAREMIRTALKLAKDESRPSGRRWTSRASNSRTAKSRCPSRSKRRSESFAKTDFSVSPRRREWGGMAMPHSLNIAATEIFSGANMAFTMYAELTYGAAHIIEAFGSDEMKAKYLEKMYTGQWTGTMCLTEPGAGSDVGALKTKAFPNGDGSYHITGSKIFISSGDHDMTDNIIHPVLARIDGAPDGIKGVSLFLVPKYLVNGDGRPGEFNDVVTGNIEHKLGIKGNATCTLNFGDHGKCVGWLVGEENKGIVYMFQMMNEARLYVGMQGQSVAATAYMNALKYAKERIQFTHVRDMGESRRAARGDHRTSGHPPHADVHEVDDRGHACDALQGRAVGGHRRNRRGRKRKEAL
ncbi:MAG: acyl-CoA dehydrogenase family protein [Deltaproteobacteria bacterium]|nr:acyl-CoA dehydrogenase family protein [Deltaproteobacteria bacterium]